MTPLLFDLNPGRIFPGFSITLFPNVLGDIGELNNIVGNR